MESKAALASLDKFSLKEISTYNHPQPVFLACLKVLCVMIGCTPDEKQASKYDPEGVFHVAKKDLLSDSFGLLKTLNNFDKNSLTPDKLKIID